MDDGGLTMGAGCRHEGGLMGGGESDAWAVTPTCSPLSLTLSPEGRGNHLWGPRLYARQGALGDAGLGAPQTFDRGVGATPTKTPSPLTGEGWGEGEQRTVVPEVGGTLSLTLSPEGRGDTCLVSEVVKRSFQQPHVVKQVALTLPANTPSPLRGRAGERVNNVPRPELMPGSAEREGSPRGRGSVVVAAPAALQPRSTPCGCSYNSEPSFRRTPESSEFNRPKPSPSSAINHNKLD
jgi:hypothetical protein